MASSTTVAVGTTYDDTRSDLTSSDTVTVNGGTYDDQGLHNAVSVDVTFTLSGGGISGGGGPVSVGNGYTVNEGQAIDSGSHNTEAVTVGAGAVASDTGSHNADTVSVAAGYVILAGWNHLLGNTTVPAGAYTDSGHNNADTVSVNGGIYADTGIENSDTVTVTAGAATESGHHGSDTLYVESGATAADTGATDGGHVYLQGGVFTEAGSHGTAIVDMTGGGTFVDQTTFNGTVEHLNPAGTLIVEDGTGAGSAAESYAIHGDTVILDFASGHAYALNFDSTANLTVTENGTQFDITDPVCFASGSRIMTTRGDVAVERLAIGDLVVTASGAERPIIWIGHRRIERPSHAQWPVRVQAGAFGEGLPSRGLRLSPGHAVCVDVMGEVFVPISELVNGDTIAREEVAEVTYWHVELESHDVLLAEGLPCESYMDAGNRAWFGREYGRLATVDPVRVAESLTCYARPFVDHGPIVEAIRQRLMIRAQALAPTTDEALAV
jgi:hypothetical protein